MVMLNSFYEAFIAIFEFVHLFELRLFKTGVAKLGSCGPSSLYFRFGERLSHVFVAASAR